MDLKPLFELQAKLDQHIIENHNLEGQDLLPNLILGLQVEIAELANETRCFKHWSVKAPAPKERQLEEYVDGLHLVLSIGLRFGYKNYERENCNFNYAKEKDITTQFTRLLQYRLDKVNYPHYVSRFLALGEMLGFSWEEVEQAYLEKNKVNHERQEHGY